MAITYTIRLISDILFIFSQPTMVRNIVIKLPLFICKMGMKNGKLKLLDISFQHPSSCTRYSFTRSENKILSNLL
jgi:hypothetical protein